MHGIVTKSKILLLAVVACFMGLVGAQPAVAGELRFFSLGRQCHAYSTYRDGETPLASGVVRSVPIAAQCPIPPTARAIAGNLRTSEPTGDGYLVAYAGDQSTPVASSINFTAGSTVSNAGIFELSRNGTGKLALLAGIASNAPSIGSTGKKPSVHVRIDVRGYFAEADTPIEPSPYWGIRGPLGFEQVEGCRLADTRAAGGAMTPLETRNFGVQERCNIPAGTVAAAVSVVAVTPTGNGGLFLGSADTFPPVNPTLATSEKVGTRAQLEFPPLGATPGADLGVTYGEWGLVDGDTNVVLDTTGYFMANRGVPYTPIQGCRAVDTRSATGGGALTGGSTRHLDLRGPCGIPDFASSVIVNVTIVGPNAPGSLTIFPAGAVRPPTSAINFAAGDSALGNTGIYGIPEGVDSNEDLAVFAGMPAGSAVHFIVDVFGYFGSLVGNAEPGGRAPASRPLSERGFAAGKMYQLDDLESVNLMNGNVNIGLPIGPRYPVGAGLDYGFQLVYNAKIFDQEPWSTPSPGTTQAATVRAFPNRLSNAGVGWTLSLGGQLLSPEDPTNPTFTGLDPATWVYVSPDGAPHIFYNVLNAYDGSSPSEPVDGVFYTRDNTYMRFKLLPEFQDKQADLEMPNGLIYHFAITDWTLPSGGVDRRWRLRSIKNRFGSGLTAPQVSIDYLPGQWRVTDRPHSRTQTVTFIEGGQYPAIVSEVKVTASAGRTAVYSFGYTVERINPGTQNTDFGVDPSSFDIPVLRSLTLPDGSVYSMDVYRGASPGDHTGGMMSRLTLPTGGSVEWTYQTWVTSIGGCSQFRNFTTSPGVKERIYRDASSAEVARWTYEPFLSAPIYPEPLLLCGESPFYYPQRPASEWASTTVTTPLKDKIVAYFSTLPDPLTDGGSGAYPGPFRPADNGLPFRRDVPPPGGGNLFLSKQTFDCDAGGEHCALERSEYVRYERDKAYGQNLDMQRRVAASRTVFVTDGNRYVEIDNDNFDGLGHYRSTTKRGNFQSSEVSRTEFTDFNDNNGTYRLDEATHEPGDEHTFSMPEPSAPWVLGTYDEHWMNSGTSTIRERYCFDHSTGFLDRKRIQYNPENKSDRDVLMAYSPHSDGNIKTEKAYGGDNRGVPTDTCGGTLTDESFHLEHEYSGGVRKSSRYIGTGLTFKVMDLDIDVRSGLAVRSRDAAGLATDHEYDLMGRSTWAKQVASGPGGRDAWTEVEYKIASPIAGACHDSSRDADELGGCARVTVRQRASASQTGAVLAEIESYADGLGREILTRTHLPGGNWTNVATDYNGMNWKVRVSAPSSVPTFATLYEQYDPFGRPRRIVPPDGGGHEVKISYGGIRSIDRIVRIATGAAGQEASATTTEVYDALGRLVSVAEPRPTGDGTSQPNATSYSYDTADRLLEVEMKSGAATQRRSFGYDGLGFRRWEDHPETELAEICTEDGCVPTAVHDREYPKYTPMGHLLQKKDGETDLSYSYDRAGRLLTVRKTATQEPVKAFTYDRLGGSAQGFSDGQIVRASRTNHFAVAGGTANTLHTVEILQDYSYSGREGRVSSQSMRLKFDGEPDNNDDERFAQSFGYDELGNVNSLTYPKCLFPACTNVTTGAGGGPDRTITYGYDQGMLNNVHGYATLSYAANGALLRVAMANGKVWQQDKDANNMSRPRWICLKSVAAGDCVDGVDSWGPYEYDGIGNVKTIGGESYRYDLLRRLVRGQLKDGSWQSYTYDPFGNVTATQSNLSGFGRSIPTNSATNRLGGLASYDSNGSLLSWNGQQYEYDDLSQLSAIRNLDGGNSYYIYDAAGERVLTITLATAAHPRHDRWTLRGLDGSVLRAFEATYSQTGTVWSWVQDYVYRGSTLLATERPGQTAWFAVDHLGTPRAIVNGTAISRHEYFPYGEERTAGDAEVLKFTGHERDLRDPAGTGDDLDYMHARFYNPQLGRFLSVDPAGHSAGVWSLFGYVNGSPLGLVDRTGMQGDLPASMTFTPLFEATIRNNGEAGYQGTVVVGRLNLPDGRSVEATSVNGSGISVGAGWWKSNSNFWGSFDTSSTNPGATNCVGSALAGGAVWINPSSDLNRSTDNVGTILQALNYEPVGNLNEVGMEPGDALVYKDKNGKPIHVEIAVDDLVATGQDGLATGDTPRIPGPTACTGCDAEGVTIEVNRQRDESQDQ